MIVFFLLLDRFFIVVVVVVESVVETFIFSVKESSIYRDNMFLAF
jgi:hypothetical protein